MVSYLSKARSSGPDPTTQKHGVLSPHPTTFGFRSSDGGIGLVQTRSRNCKKQQHALRAKQVEAITTLPPKRKTSPSIWLFAKKQQYVAQMTLVLLVLIGSWILKKEENPKDIAGFQ